MEIVTAAPVDESRIRLPLRDGVLEADLTVPDGAGGLVIFAHGSGNRGRSVRNRRVAASLHDARLATLLFDLLSREEEAEDARTARLRFDVDMLADRLGEVTDLVVRNTALQELRIGYFGASTGAAAALIAAAGRPGVVRAVVSRGGRPDLAGETLADVRAPTLFIVGADDAEVLELNRSALRQLMGRKQLAVVPNATHLFPEPGALDEVARLARTWFAHHLCRDLTDRRGAIA